MMKERKSNDDVDVLLEREGKKGLRYVNYGGNTVLEMYVTVLPTVYHCQNAARMDKRLYPTIR